ncbi:MAG: hypothetical protein V2J02_18605 [Pseudomonadales bacterium]|jgi:hypothetical protein|nr:hypothetical protein [Pseudomonadales bacterium]
MLPDRPNPQPPDPFRRKIRAADYARCYGLTVAGVLRQIRTNRIAAEQPAGPGSTWYVWLDADDTTEREAAERMILADLERRAG